MAEKMRAVQAQQRIRSWWFTLGIAFALSSATAGEWPQGHVLYEESRSPDGHYGIVLPGRETGAERDSDNDNYFADLTAQKFLGKIAGADYFEGQNHRGLQVTWAPDSRWCVATYEDRFGFDFVSVLEPKGRQFTQTDVGEHIGKAMDAIIARQANDPKAEGFASAHFRARPDRKLLVRALAYTNPKQLEDVRSLFAAFEGTFDLNSKKWTASRARKISSDEFDALLNGYSDYTASDEENAERIETTLNEVYQAVRVALPAGRFAAVQQQQRAWLKKRDAISSPDKKFKFTEARIRTLQDLLW